MKKAILLVCMAVLVYFVYASVQVECPAKPDPGKDYALVPNPCNCSSYYVCQGQHYPPTCMPCPAGLHWNKQKKICDYPYNASCTEDLACYSRNMKVYL